MALYKEKATKQRLTSCHWFYS